MNTRVPENGGMSPNTGIPARAWLVLAAIFIASVAAPVNRFKVPPVMPALIHRFGLTMTSTGFLMSVYSLAGLIVAFPAGGIVARLGQHRGHPDDEPLPAGHPGRAVHGPGLPGRRGGRVADAHPMISAI